MRKPLSTTLKRLDDVGVCGMRRLGAVCKTQSALSEGYAAFVNVKLHDTQLDVIIVSHHVIQCTRAMNHSIRTEAFDNELIFKPVLVRPLLLNIFKNRFALLFVELVVFRFADGVKMRHLS